MACARAGSEARWKGARSSARVRSDRDRLARKLSAPASTNNGLLQQFALIRDALVRGTINAEQARALNDTLRLGSRVLGPGGNNGGRERPDVQALLDDEVDDIDDPTVPTTPPPSLPEVPR